ncbi:MAG TPA: DUF5668 domain-containing protein [Bryobacteraceae bacterium]|jgi:hypothetical protein|nr:DUF5668 domain-containing protein [Bryobacteraceae bacterium]
MRLFYPGRMAVPTMVISAGVLLMMSRFDIIHIARYQNLWPVVLIAAGIERLYLWSVSGEDR